MAALQTLLERELRAETTREKVVDRLHAELQEYKQDLLLNVLRPVFVDLIQLHDDVGKMAVSLAEMASESLDSTRIHALFGGIQQGIEDILYRQGVEPFTHHEEQFDAKRQRAVSTVPTTDPRSHDRSLLGIARVLRGAKRSSGRKSFRFMYSSPPLRNPTNRNRAGVAFLSPP